MTVPMLKMLVSYVKVSNSASLTVVCRRSERVSLRFSLRVKRFNDWYLITITLICDNWGELHTTAKFSCIWISVLHTLPYGMTYRCMLVHYTMGLTELYSTSVHLEAYATQRFERSWNSLYSVTSLRRCMCMLGPTTYSKSSLLQITKYASSVNSKHADQRW